MKGFRTWFKDLKMIGIGLLIGSSVAVGARFIITDTLQLKPGTLPAVAVSRDGQLVVDSADNKLKKFNETVSSWEEITGGAGAAGGINYLTDDDTNFEATVGTWVAYADAAADRPVNCTGGAPTLTMTRATSNPLRGSGNGLITKDAANRQGEGASVDFTVDRAESEGGPAPVAISFDYEVKSGTFDFGDGTILDLSDLIVTIFDVTNSVFVEPGPIVLDGSGKFVSEFQPNSDSASYRLCVHEAKTGAVAYTLALDTVVIGPGPKVVGAAVSDWVAYTPTGDWTTNTAYTGFWRRVGDQMEVLISVKLSGAPDAVSLDEVTIPTGATIDTTKQPAVTSDARIVGDLLILDSGTNIRLGGEIRNGAASVNTLQPFADAGIGVAGTINATNPITWASGDEIVMRAQFPIQGWGSVTNLSHDADTRVISARHSTNTATAVVTGNVIPFEDEDFDTHQAMSPAGVFTAPIQGTYWVSANTETGSVTPGAVNQGYSMILRKNGSTEIQGLDVRAQQAAAATNFSASLSGAVTLVAGDTLDIVWNEGLPAVNLTGASSQNYFSVERMSGPAVITMSETVVARHSTNTTTAVVSGNVIPFEDEDFDTHGALSSGGVFTAPISGWYHATANTETGAVTPGAINQGYSMILRINGTDTLQGFDNRASQAASARNFSASVSGDLRLNAGDTVDIIWSETIPAVNLTGASTQNYFSVHKIGGVP